MRNASLEDAQVDLSYSGNSRKTLGTGSSAFSLKSPDANLRMDATSVNFGDDFVLSRDLATGRSTIGSAFGMQTGVDAQRRLTGSSDGKFSVLRVEAWLVDVNEVEAGRCRLIV